MSGTQFKLLSNFYRPRQFEFHPQAGKNELIFGTLTGEMCIVSTLDNEEKNSTLQDDREDRATNIKGNSFDLTCYSDPVRYLGHFGANNNDPILGICWLRKSSDKFITGSSEGRICLGTTSMNMPKQSIVKQYLPFKRLTSVHINSENKYLLCSGYTKDVRIDDLETGTVLSNYENIHDSHVNISRFCNLSPFLFATSSFDSTCKLWDIRLPVRTNIYEVRCNSGLVMINFSPDDTYLLASALDNEITQFLTVDGKRHTQYNLPKTGLEGNFTRAYYSSTGSYVVTGACEEQNVRILCAASGEVLNSTDIYPARKHSSLYIQSLRGSPNCDDTFAVLANYRDLPNREIVIVQLPRSRPLDDLMGVVEDNPAVAIAPVDSVAAFNPNSSDSPPCLADLRESLYLPSPALAQTMDALRVAAQIVDVSILIEGSSGSQPAYNPMDAHPYIPHEIVQVDRESAAAAGVDAIICSGVFSMSNAAASTTARAALELDQWASGAHQFVLRSRCPVLANMIDRAVSDTKKCSPHRPPLALLCLDFLLESVDAALRGDIISATLHYLYCGDAAVDLKKLRRACLNAACPGLSTDSISAFVGRLKTSECTDAGDTDMEPEDGPHRSLLQGGGSMKFSQVDLRDALIREAVNDEALWRSAPLTLAMLHFLEQLHVTASALALERLASICEIAASKCVLPRTVLRVLEIAERRGLPRMRARAMQYLTNNLELCRALHPRELASDSALSQQVTQMRHKALLPAMKIQSEALAMSPRIYKQKMENLPSSPSHSTHLDYSAQLNAAGSEPDASAEAMEYDSNEDTPDNSDNISESMESGGEVHSDDDEDALPMAADQSNDDNEQLWLRRGDHTTGRNTRWISAFPRFMGHSMLSGPDPDLVLIIGGKDHSRYHFPRLVYAFSTEMKGFTLLDAGDGTVRPTLNLRPRGSGSGPDSTLDLSPSSCLHTGVNPDQAIEHCMPSFLFHCTAPIERPTSRHILVCGGLMEQEKHPKDESRPSVLVLDCLTMTWSRAHPIGFFSLENVVSATALTPNYLNRCKNRLRHSMCSIYPSRAAAPFDTNHPSTAASPVTHTNSDQILDALSERLSQVTTDAFGSLEAWMNFPASSIVSMHIVFGGLAPSQTVVFNDDTMVLLAMAPPSTNKKRASTHRSPSNRLEAEASPVFAWIAPKLVGQSVPSFQPDSRIHHSACIIPLPEATGGSRHIVYGGLSPQQILGDVRSLRLGNFAQPNGAAAGPSKEQNSVMGACQRWNLEWEEVIVNGASPDPRYGHTMTLITTTENEQVLVLVGGTSYRGQVSMLEIWLLTVTDAQPPRIPGNNRSCITVRWDKAATTIGLPIPPPRMLHQTIVHPQHSESLLVFGGTMGHLNSSTCVEACMFQLDIAPSSGSSSNMSPWTFKWSHYSNQPDGRNGGDAPASSRVISADTQLEAQCEPSIVITADTLHQDLATLFQAGHGDICFELKCRAKAPSVGGRIYAHRALIVRRCSVMRTMLEWEDERKDACSEKCDNGSQDDEGVPVIQILDDDFMDEVDATEDTYRQRSEQRLRVFRSMVEFLYSDSLSCAPDDVTALLSLANRYGLQRLSQLCEHFLVRQVTSDSAGPLLQYADWLNLETLKAVCFTNVLRCGWRDGHVAGEDGTSDRVESLGLGSDLSELSPDLRAEIDLYRTTCRHAYLFDHADNKWAQLFAADRQRSEELERQAR